MNKSDFDAFERLQHKILMDEADKNELIRLYLTYIDANFNFGGCGSCGGSDKLREAKNRLFAFFNANKARMFREICEKENDSNRGIVDGEMPPAEPSEN
jgi:hypothetical protein